MKSFLRYWLPVIVLCAVIFWQSGHATPRILPRWPHQDKLLHCVVYGLLGALWVRAFSSLKGFHSRRCLLLAGIALATLFGLSDEWHQSFVPARTADAADLLADFVGSLIGSWFYIRFVLARFSVGPLAR